MKKAIILLLLALGLHFGTKAQSGWSAGNYYAYQGQSSVSCSNAYYKYYPNGAYAGTYQACRKLVWEQQWVSGYVYFWGPNGWYSEERSGTYWYCYWYDYEYWLGY